MSRTIVLGLVVLGAAASSVFAQGAPKAANAPTSTTAPAGVEVPPGYVIGVQDSLDVIVWKDQEMSAQGVVVRPDGKISLPLVNELQAAGLTVEQLREAITKGAEKYVQEPTVSVVVKQINSLSVSIVGQVAKTGPYPLLRPTTVVELISQAGGVAEYAQTKNIRINRTENGKQVSKVFNYKDFLKGKPAALAQNIELKPGDIVTVP